MSGEIAAARLLFAEWIASQDPRDQTQLSGDAAVCLEQCAVHSIRVDTVQPVHEYHEAERLVRRNRRVVV